MAAVSGAWKLYTWGDNSTGQLGLDSQYIEENFVKTPTLVNNKLVDLHPIKLVGLGKYHTVCVTDEGVISWGKLELLGQALSKQPSNALLLESATVAVPQLISMPEPVTHVSCGAGHTTLVTESGELYTFGTGNMGQLGHGDISDRALPTVVEYFKKNNKVVTSTGCGGYHTVCITQEGRTYAFGLSSYGQTGQGPNAEPMLLAPQPIVMPAGIQIAEVACGESHTLFLSTQGQVMACGYNIYGQCGQGNRRDQHLPMPVKFETQDPMAQISCGANHSAAVSRGGQLYLWGSGERYQLTLSATKDRTTPAHTPFDYPVRSVSCGDAYTMILTGGPSKTPNTTIYSDLASLLMVKEFSDVTLTARNDVAFPAHKVVVFHRCPVLRANFGDDVSTIKLPDLSKDALYKLLEFMYTDFTYVEEDSPEASELRAFSEKFALPKLANLCGDLKESSASNFISEMKLALKNASFHDVTFMVGDRVINANRAILAARCKFFRAMFTSGYQESSQSTVKIDDCNPETFVTFLEWCYTDIINLSLPAPPNSPHFSSSESILAKSGESEGEEGSSLLPEMLVLADKYGAFSLFRLVEGKLLEGVEVGNIVGLLLLAETYNANYLSEFCLKFIAREYDKVMEKGGEKEIGEELMRKVRERRAMLLEDSQEERQKAEMEKRMRMYELERKEQMESPYRAELIKKFQTIMPTSKHNKNNE
eukprot:Phypoly_transcript_03469.p1 GENE.Phypoly_transcript_03469~~Phypoly_transcript_03469.p1  ORF type:complete len:804 (+),score=150.71 Phypoly_transcript_03469:292-2412(+)